MSTTQQQLVDISGQLWLLTVNPDGSLSTVQPTTAVTPAYVTTAEEFIDSLGQMWSVSVNPDGTLTTTPYAGSAYNPFILANDIIQSVINDGQVQVTNRTVLLDYVNRVHQRILRDTQWAFLRSDLQRFITQPNTTDYWIGAGNPQNTVPTGLNLSDVWSIDHESVYDRSNHRPLRNDISSVRNRSIYSQPDGTFKVGQPENYAHVQIFPNVLSIFPAADNKNTLQPVPLSPICVSTSGGTQTSRIYYVGSTFVDDLGNESSLSATPTPIYVPGNYLLKAQSPNAEINSAVQLSYSKWNVYVGLSPASMTKQNAAPIAIGSAFIEPTTGLIVGVAAPKTNSLTPLYGYVIEFRYFRKRKTLTLSDNLMIPIEYRDIVIAGVNYYSCLYGRRTEEYLTVAAAWKQEFLDGIRQMRKDLNQNFKTTDLILPDPVVQQINIY